MKCEFYTGELIIIIRRRCNHVGTNVLGILNVHLDIKCI